MRRAQDATALSAVERLDRFAEGEPADLSLLERGSAAAVGHQEVRDCDASPILPLLHGSQAPDEPRAHARFLTYLAQRSRRAGFPVLDAALRKDPPAACAARLDEEITRPLAGEPEYDAASVGGTHEQARFFSLIRAE